MIPLPKIDKPEEKQKKEKQEKAKQKEHSIVIPGPNAQDTPDKLFKLTDKWLREGKRYFGKPGISLANQLVDPKFRDLKINAKVVGLGIQGEKRTSKILREWMYDKPDVVLLDSISLPFKEKLEEQQEEDGTVDLGDTDHALIIGSTIFIIDSKNWKTKSTYRVDESGVILRGTKKFTGSNVRINQCRYLWLNFLSNYDIDDIECYICVPASEEEKDENGEIIKRPIIVRDKNWWRSGFKALNQYDFVRFLDRAYEDIPDKGYIRTDLVAKLFTGLVQEYEPIKEKFPYIYDVLKM